MDDNKQRPSDALYNLSGNLENIDILQARLRELRSEQAELERAVTSNEKFCEAMSGSGILVGSYVFKLCEEGEFSAEKYLAPLGPWEFDNE